ncbi:MAG: hypothetical protein ACLQU2_26900 [Candidatus Binataceae bacterium]
MTRPQSGHRAGYDLLKGDGELIGVARPPSHTSSRLNDLMPGLHVMGVTGPSDYHVQIKHGSVFSAALSLAASRR